MSTKKISGIITILLGGSLIFTSLYIKYRVKEGREEISAARSEVRKGNKLLSLNPITKKLGKGFMESAQDKIDEGEAAANRYDELATYLQMGGAVFIVLGAGLLFIGKKK